MERPRHHKEDLVTLLPRESQIIHATGSQNLELVT